MELAAGGLNRGIFSISCATKQPNFLNSDFLYIVIYFCVTEDHLRLEWQGRIRTQGRNLAAGRNVKIDQPKKISFAIFTELRWKLMGQIISIGFPISSLDELLIPIGPLFQL